MTEDQQAPWEGGASFDGPAFAAPFSAPAMTPASAPATLTAPATVPVMNPDILIVDINGLGYAAMYTPMGKLSFNGLPTGGIHGAIFSLLTRMAERPGAVPFVLWDNKAVWRHDACPEYKLTRHLDPVKAELKETYRQQVPVIQMMLGALGIPQISCGGAEADDLAGLICRGLDPQWLIEMVSRDTDWWQALRENVVWYSPIHKKQMTLADLQDPLTDNKDGHFLSTDEYLEAKALAGDTSDEIGGIEGVGLKTATKIMRLHGGSAGSLWAKVDSGELKPKGVVIERVAQPESRAIFQRNIQLMDWRKAPALDANSLSLTSGRPDWALASAIADEYGLAKVLSRARTVLKPWDGWGTAVDAVSAALDPEFCMPIAKPGTTLQETVTDDEPEGPKFEEEQKIGRTASLRF